MARIAPPARPERTDMAMMVFHFLTLPWVKGPLIAAVIMLVMWKLLTADG